MSYVQKLTSTGICLKEMSASWILFVIISLLNSSKKLYKIVQNLLKTVSFSLECGISMRSGFVLKFHCVTINIRSKSILLITAQDGCLKS